MPCTQQPPIDFIVLREFMRNGGIGYIPVQRLHLSVNHWAVHCVRLTVKIFMNFTRIDCRAEKMSRRCTARYGIDGSCTLLYAGFVYQPPIRRQVLHSAVKYSTMRTSKMVFKNEIKNSRTGCTACTAVLKSGAHFQYGSGLTTSMPTKPRTRLPPTWTLLVASTL